MEIGTWAIKKKVLNLPWFNLWKKDIFLQDANRIFSLIMPNKSGILAGMD